MKKLNATYLSLLLMCVAAVQLTGCRKYETYAEKKEKEDNAIAKFIDDGGIDGRPIKVITEEEFYAQECRCVRTRCRRERSG